MSFPYWPGVVLLALLPVAAIAQQARVPGPTDPDAPVPASTYVSAFEHHQVAPEPQATPDAVWRSANDAAANPTAHAGHGADPATPGLEAEARVPQPAPGHDGHHH